MEKYDKETILVEFINKTQQQIDSVMYNEYGMTESDYTKYVSRDTILAITMFLKLQDIEMLFCEQKDYKKLLSKRACDILHLSSDDDLSKKNFVNFVERLKKRTDKTKKYFDVEASPTGAQQVWFNYRCVLNLFRSVKNFVDKDEGRLHNDFWSRSPENSLVGFYSFVEDNFFGYEKFKLLHKFEVDTKIEMAYKYLSMLKQYKKRYRWDAKKTEDIIQDFISLHKVKGCMWNNTEFIGNYANQITFDFDELLKAYINMPGQMNNDKVKSYIQCLNHAILYIRIHHESEPFVDKICSEAIDNDITLLEFFYKWLSKNGFNNYFEVFLRAHNYVDYNKNPGEDITMTHFKKLFSLKKDV